MPPPPPPRPRYSSLVPIPRLRQPPRAGVDALDSSHCGNPKLVHTRYGASLFLAVRQPRRWMPQKTADAAALRLQGSMMTSSGASVEIEHLTVLGSRRSSPESAQHIPGDKACLDLFFAHEGLAGASAHRRANPPFIPGEGRAKPWRHGQWLRSAFGQFSCQPFVDALQALA